MTAFSGKHSTTLAVTASSARVAIPDTSVPNLADPTASPLNRGVKVARIMLGPGTLVAADVVYIAYGDSAVVATAANGIPLIPGLVELHRLEPTDTHVAAIASANATTMYITIGEEN